MNKQPQSILIIEPTPTIFTILNLILVRRHHCIYANSLTEALKHLQNAPLTISLVITEYKLSDGISLDVIKLFQKLHIPCIGISSNPHQKTKILEAGATAFLPKPVDYDQLLNVIRKCVF
jgi:DNA-binding NtrC family response regulator